MLSNMLKTAATYPAGAPQFVGGITGTSSSQTPSFSLTSLSGGLASRPAIGDIVIAVIGFSNATNRDIQCTTAGYTEVADLFANPLQMGVYYKVLTTAETSVAFNLGVVATSNFLVHVWRQINSTPLDATSTTATTANPPDITTVTPLAVVIAISQGANSFGTPTLVGNTGLLNTFTATRTAGLAGSRMVIASKLVSLPSTYDPPALMNSATIGISTTMALRPI